MAISGSADVPRRVADALFLRRYGRFDWQTLQDTPADIVRLIRLIDNVEAEVSESRARMAQMQQRG